MSRLVGILNDRKIYDNDPKLTELLGNANFVAVLSPYSSGAGAASYRCDYCGRSDNKGDDCKSCGAPPR